MVGLVSIRAEAGGRTPSPPWLCRESSPDTLTLLWAQRGQPAGTQAAYPIPTGQSVLAKLY